MQPPILKDHLCSEQIQQVQKLQFSHVEPHQQFFMFLSAFVILHDQKAIKRRWQIWEKQN